MTQFKDQHLPANASDITRLEMVTTPQLLEQDELAQSFRCRAAARVRYALSAAHATCGWCRKNKFRLRMSAATYELLLSFLREQRMLYFVYMINLYLDVQVIAALPTTQSESETGAAAPPVLMAESTSLVQSINQRAVYWGAFTAGNGDEAPDAGGGGAATSERVVPARDRIPLPRRDADFDGAAREKLAVRRLGRGVPLPSRPPYA